MSSASASNGADKAHLTLMDTVTTLSPMYRLDRKRCPPFRRDFETSVEMRLGDGIEAVDAGL
jgi:hypothetical protein